MSSSWRNYEGREALTKPALLDHADIIDRVDVALAIFEKKIEYLFEENNRLHNIVENVRRQLNEQNKSK